MDFLLVFLTVGVAAGLLIAAAVFTRHVSLLVRLGDYVLGSLLVCSVVGATLLARRNVDEVLRLHPGRTFTFLSLLWQSSDYWPLRSVDV